ncbi:hypothetical protein [Roseateles sp. LKC17W]|uniref:DUF3806 domain-containing protein n=1 Tax=Pelomonas margarita TaxID=3299031 RepID=A0ABW7FJ93_9BURK
MSLSVHASPTREALQLADLDAVCRDELAEHARSMVDVAKEGFGVELDGSRASLEGLEQVLAECAEHMAQAGISAASEQSQMLIAIAGAYLGEVFRQAMGGNWYTLRAAGPDDGQLCLRTGGDKPAVLLPLSRVTRRLTEGPEFNVWHYAQVAWSVAD